MITHPNVKVNLGLNVLRKRPDGYHDLETLFVPYFGLTDTLEIITGEDYSRTIAGLQERYENLAQAISPDGKLMITIARKEGVDWDPLKDLTAKAYQMLAEDHKLPPMKIFLEKTNPVGAGLGGGSADAAFALRMISELAELKLSDEQLAAYAARLGSDCAFFIYNTPMMGSGRGEILEPFPLDLKGLRLEVIVPEGISVSTADAYRGIRPGIPAKPLAEVLRQDPATWKEDLKNDFEETVFAKYPELAQIKAQIYLRGALYCAMSGSGSSLYALFRP
ncbi:MAG: 4-(cytidine 5'-diphospho)-2-C-methyl-D-erythritol kinase [Bacteroidales bacterium]|nr:4-(cytidine 5'-diphospho)-2-C-methyl-D-erythritol kinase [Bacteroidales bacterium]